MASDEFEVRVGQVWADNDPRAKGRLIRITEVHDADDHRPEPYVRVTVEKIGRNVRKTEVGEQRTILQRRLRPTRNGYKLVQDVTPEQQASAPYPQEEAQKIDADAWKWGGVDMTPGGNPDAEADN